MIFTRVIPRSQTLGGFDADLQQSRQNLIDDMPMHVRQPPLDAVVTERQPPVIDAQHMEDGGVQIVAVGWYSRYRRLANSRHSSRVGGAASAVDFGSADIHYPFSDTTTSTFSAWISRAAPSSSLRRVWKASSDSPARCRMSRKMSA